MGEVAQEGMALRDYLAAHAPPLPQFLRDALADAKRFKQGKQTVDLQDYADQSAEWALRYADAVLKAMSA